MIGGWEIMVILFVTLILFGGKKLPEFARNLGKGIFEFKKASQGFSEEFEIDHSHIVAVKKDVTSSDEQP